MRQLPSPSLTDRDLAILDRLAEHEPLTTSELHLLFFAGLRTCQARLKLLDEAELLCRIYPARSSRGGKSEPLWFLTPHGRRMIGAPSRRLPGLSIPDLEHRRAVARFFLALVERSLRSDGEGLHSWWGETRAAAGVGGGPLRPDGYGRYLLPDGEMTFYLELDRGTEPARRVADKLTAYQHGLANDPEPEYANVLLHCDSRRRLANLAGYAPEGPPWTWGTIDAENYELLPDRKQERPFDSLPRRARDPSRHIDNCPRPPMAARVEECRVSGRPRRHLRAVQPSGPSDEAKAHDPATRRSWRTSAPTSAARRAAASSNESPVPGARATTKAPERLPAVHRGLRGEAGIPRLKAVDTEPSRPGGGRQRSDEPAAGRQARRSGRAGTGREELSLEHEAFVEWFVDYWRRRCARRLAERAPNEEEAA